MRCSINDCKNFQSHFGNTSIGLVFAIQVTLIIWVGVSQKSAGIFKFNLCSWETPFKINIVCSYVNTSVGSFISCQFPWTWKLKVGNYFFAGCDKAKFCNHSHPLSLSLCSLSCPFYRKMTKWKFLKLSWNIFIESYFYQKTNFTFMRLCYKTFSQRSLQ